MKSQDPLEIPEEKLNLGQRIIAIHAACGAVGKNREAPAASGGYAFSGIDDVIEHLRPHLIEHGVLVVLSVVDSSLDIRDGRNGKSIFIERQTVEVAFQNADQPDDSFSIQVVGMGIGSGDKVPGIAFSYALKTALLAVFNLRGQPDADEGTGQVPAGNGPRSAQSGPPRRGTRGRSPEESSGQRQEGKGDEATEAQQALLRRFMNDDRAQTMVDDVTIRSRLSVMLDKGCTKKEASEAIGWVQDEFKKEAVA